MHQLFDCIDNTIDNATNESINYQLQFDIDLTFDCQDVETSPILISFKCHFEHAKECGKCVKSMVFFFSCFYLVGLSFQLL